MTMKGLFGFMAATSGRVIRVVAGLSLIVIGIVFGGAWWILAVVGLVPLLAGALDVCLLAPVFGAPLRGRALRSHA
jgi:hypothetical protein